MILSDEKKKQLEMLREGQSKLSDTPKTERKDYRADGYKNLLNKYGTPQDNTEAYVYTPEGKIPDIELTHHYESNGLFAKIIDAPAEELVKHGFELGIDDEQINTLIRDIMDDLDWEEKAATAAKWTRLYGGAIAVMLLKDGGSLDEPVNWNKVKGIDEIRVYERAIVQPDYTALYSGYGDRSTEKSRSKFGLPEYFYVFSITGYFRVHESRCLIFKNGALPELGMTAEYRFWGIPEYLRIKRQLRETITAHGDSVKLLERSVQAIYKMKNLSQLLATDEGEDQAMKRLQLIDMARGILNSIAIDSEGEDYAFQTFALSGVREVIDSTCNMLSAITEIPQTILFGRSPAGMSATGESDLENYYNYIDKLRKMMLKHNLIKLVDIILRSAYNCGEIENIPKYKLEFSPLWSLSETEQAQVEQTKANTAQVKATTAQIYVDMGALDPSEVREGLKSENEYVIEDLVDDESEDILTPEERTALLQIKMQDEQPQEEGGEQPPEPEQTAPQEQPVAQEPTMDNLVDVPSEVQEDEDDVPAENDTETEPNGNELIEKYYEGMSKAHRYPIKEEVAKDEEPVAPTSAAVIVIKDGKVLCGDRKDGQGICGPGGHIEGDESPEECAMRETWEEFGITLTELIDLGTMTDLDERYGTPQIFLSTEFSGEVPTNPQEMENNRFCELFSLQNGTLFEPFARSLDYLLSEISKGDDAEETGNQKPFQENDFTNDSDSDIMEEQADGGKGSGKHKGHGASHPTPPDVDYVAARKYSKEVKGTVTSTGIEIKKVSGHAGYRMKTKDITPDDIKSITTNPDAVYPGNRKHKDATCFQGKGTRLVVSADGTIITTVDLEDDDD